MNAQCWLAATAAAMCVGGCASDPTQGYSFASPFPQGITTIAVEVFENKTFDRGIEFELTDAVIKEIEARTPYKVTSESRADTILTGRIQRVERTQLSKSELTGLSEEVTVSVTIDLHWRDLRTGKPLLALEAYTGHGLFVPSTPTGEPAEIGEFAVVQALAHDIVGEMRADW